MHCPRCNTVNSPAARFCSMCGLPLTQQGGQADTPGGHAEAPLQVGNAPPLPVPPTAYQQLLQAEQPRLPAGQSVLQALRVGRPAKWQFWVGLSMLLIVLVCCPCSVGLLIFGSDAVADPAGFVTTILGLGACLFLVGLALGIVLMTVGRPRRLT